MNEKKINPRFDHAPRSLGPQKTLHETISTAYDTADNEGQLWPEECEALELLFAWIKRIPGTTGEQLTWLANKISKEFPE